MLLLTTARTESICTQAASPCHAVLTAPILLAPLCAADGSTPLPVHVVIGNAGAELCWNVAPKTPNHFEVLFDLAVRPVCVLLPSHVWDTISGQPVHFYAQQ